MIPCILSVAFRRRSPSASARMGRVLVVTPTAFEGLQFPRYLAKMGSPEDSASTLAYGVGGIGTVCGQVIGHWLGQARADRLILAGFSGGLDPALPPGGIYRYDLSAGWPKEVYCSQVILEDAAAKASAFERTGALMVEMEGAHVLEVAQQHGVPCTMIRTVSDTASEIFPKSIAAGYDFATQQQKTWRFFAALGRYPGEIPEVIRLLRRWGRLRHELARAVADEVAKA